MRFTYIIPAHNEESTVATIVGQARAAAKVGDRIVVVDSASTDATAERAAAAGAEVIHGPIGKGAAMGVALSTVRTEWACFLDADLFSASTNVVAELRAAAEIDDADHILGDYEYAYPGTILGSTFTIYEPLTAELFPEVGFLGANSLTGYRAIRTSWLPTTLPPDFGVETFLNIIIAVAGGRTRTCDLGVISSRFRPTGGNMARQIGRTVLDLAHEYNRITPEARPEWDIWVEEGAEVIAGQQAKGGRSATLARLFAAVRRPMPCRTVREVQRESGDTDRSRFSTAVGAC